MALAAQSTTVVVHLWAGARAAAGVGEVTLDVDGPVTVGWVRDEVVKRFPAAERLPSVLGVCSVLVGDRPVGRGDAASVPVEPGETVEFLPPFAGG
ncbi:MoaD/ThiS family protein [Nocardioides caldifontis]|uniref:MoaD/ThiS family protein n=1 Tax=Nocardioides caldifontis TaxID=2588938 RepID=UPI0011DF04B8|nr:MoaD/ThiS family protein [Nocardioides caldifontis]